MPEPQAGTPTVVATDVDSGIRLGIGSHSVGTAQTPVKSGRAAGMPGSNAYRCENTGGAAAKAAAFRDLRASGIREGWCLA